MAGYLALLRGINLGSRRRVAMADLRALLADVGATDVRTHLQSGNALFTHAERDPEGLRTMVQHAIQRELGLKVEVVIRTQRELAGVVQRNPFRSTTDPNELHVTFLSAEPAAARWRSIDPAEYAPDEFRRGKRVVYLRLVGGVQGTKLGDQVWTKLGVVGTMRNWRTVTKLHELAG